MELRLFIPYFFIACFGKPFMDMVTIPRAEYEELKRLAKKAEPSVVEQFEQGLDDLKAGRVRRVA